MTNKVGNLNYDPEKVLGRGSISTVFAGFLDREHKDISSYGIYKKVRIKVAAKRFQNTDIIERASVRQEMELMQKANNHPNILSYIRYEENNDFLFIVTELCSGTLEDYVKDEYQGPRFTNEIEILRQMTQGLAHLHSLEIVHRDIKPSNILISVPNGSNSTKPRIKLADFGISKVLKPDREDYTNTSVTNPNGTRGWIAPELYESDRFDLKVDVWALGCIFAYTLNEGKHPFGEDISMRIDRIKKKEAMLFVQQDLTIPDSEEAFKLIQDMLATDPIIRPTAKDVLMNNIFFENSISPFVKPIDFSRELTEEFIQIGRSFVSSFNDDKIARFKELANDERVDIDGVHVDRDGTSPLFILCSYCGDHEKLFELAQLLIMRRANVNPKILTEYNGYWTPLHSLSRNGKLSHQMRIDLIKLLLENGADVNIKDDNGRSPLYNFCMYHRSMNESNLIEIIKLLIQHGAEVNTSDRSGNTPLHELCQHYRKENLIEVVQLFIENGANINAQEQIKKQSPIFFLCAYQVDKERLLDVIRLFIEKGADLEAIDLMGNTPLYELCNNYKKDELLLDIVKVMTDNGADLNADCNGETPLKLLRSKGFSCDL